MGYKTQTTAPICSGAVVYVLSQEHIQGTLYDSHTSIRGLFFALSAITPSTMCRINNPHILYRIKEFLPLGSTIIFVEIWNFVLIWHAPLTRH